MTAQDVKFSLDRFRDPKLNVIIPSLAFGFTGVSVLNPRTVQIHLQHPVGALLENLTVFPSSIIDAKLFKNSVTRISRTRSVPVRSRSKSGCAATI